MRHIEWRCPAFVPGDEGKTCVAGWGKICWRGTADMGWPGFVELQKKPETFFQTRPSVMKPASHLSITIRFGNGVSVEVGEEADRETVRWLCGMIRDIA